MRRGIGIILLTVAICAFMWHLGTEDQPVVVDVVTPAYSDIVNSVSATGRIEQIRTSNLHSGHNATVEKIYVNTGDYVLKDQILMSLSKADKLIPDDQNLGGALSEVIAQVVGGTGEIPAAEYVDGDLIKSPFDGLVSEICVRENEAVSPLKKCIVVSDISRTQAIVSVAEMDIPKITTGMPAGITGEAFGGIYNGVVLEITRQIKTSLSLTGSTDRYAEVVIELFDADMDLIPGSSVKAKIYTTQKTHVLTLPYEAISQDKDNNEVVFVVVGDRVERRKITTGYELNNQIEIISGLISGETVIVNPSDDLKEGERVLVAG